MLSQLFAHVLDSVRVNRCREYVCEEKIYILKKRLNNLDWLVVLGNVFLRWSKSRIRMFPSVSAWKKWELYSYALLHGERYDSKDIGDRSILIEKLPGRDLRSLAAASKLNAEIVESSAKELLRAHDLFSEMLGEGWSHGDPHMANFIYDDVTKKCYLIDFETYHEKQYTQLQRQADDVLVLLLDMMGRVPGKYFAEWTPIFLATYNRPTVFDELSGRLVCPRGWERVLWMTRSKHLSDIELNKKLTMLKEMLTPYTNESGNKG